MSSNSEPKTLELCMRRPVVRRAATIALIVGTILALINHGDRLIAGDVNAEVLTKILMTYMVPYCVSTYSAVLTIRERIKEEQ